MYKKNAWLILNLIMLLISYPLSLKADLTTRTAALTAEMPISTRQIRDRDFLSFGFVLLPEYSKVIQIREIADLCAKHAKKLLDASGKVFDDPYVNIPVGFPHSSVGHYGISGIEFHKIVELVDEVASEFPPFLEPMKQTLTINSANIAWTAKNIGKNTNPATVEMYKKLREGVRKGSHTLTYSHSAQFLRHEFKDDPIEKKMLEDLLQNWGTPEPEDAPRIRPHFTLLFSHHVPLEPLEKEITECQEIKAKIQSIPENLEMKYLAIVELDPWGNPTRAPLHVAPLTGGKKSTEKH